MAAKLDGYEIRRGDVVHDLMYGAGTVRYLYPDGRGAVAFGTLEGDTRTYDLTSGVMVGGFARTLFWSQPYVVPPPKERAKYAAFQTVAEALANLVIK